MIPAVVRRYDEIEDLLKKYQPYNLKEVLSELGYQFDPKERTVTLPDCELLNANCNRIKEKDGLLKSFEAVSSEGTATNKEFIQQYLDGKTLLSSGIEFTHDHTIHVLAEIILSLTGNITNVRKTINSIMTPVIDVLEKVKKMNESEDIEQLLTFCTIWIDEMSSYVDDPLKDIDHARITNMIREYGKIKGARNIFSQSYPETPLDESRIKYLTLN